MNISEANDVATLLRAVSMQTADLDPEQVAAAAVRLQERVHRALMAGPSVDPVAGAKHRPSVEAGALMRARRRRGPPRCTDCGHTIVWFRLRGRWRPFNPVPQRSGTITPAAAYPVESATAWLMADLVEELMGRREVTREDASEEVLDMPWHALHACPPIQSREVTG